MAPFHSEGIDPCFIEAEKRRNKLGVSSSTINLRYLAGSPSGPAALDGLRSFKILLIPRLSSSIGGIFGKGESPRLGRLSLSLCEKQCRNTFKMLALSWLSAKVSLLFCNGGMPEQSDHNDLIYL